jgi:serine/threonine protein kinase
LGISKRIKKNLGTPSIVRGTPQFMVPELREFTAAHSTSHGSASTNPYAADMWSLGEIAFQMLTKQPAFPQLLHVEKLNELLLEGYLGRKRATAIYIVGGWGCPTGIILLGLS